MQNPRRPFASSDDISVVLTYYLQAHLTGYTNANALTSDPAWAEHVQRAALNGLSASRGRLVREIPVSPEVDLRAMLSHRPYLARVAEIALERLRGGPDAPSLRIAPGCLPPTQARRMFGQGLCFGLIYGAETIYMQDTVLALQTDADRSQPSTDPAIHVLGVHKDQLTADMKARRALIVDETAQVSEVCFEEPLALHIVQILHLPRKGEQHIHHRISTQCESLRLPQINPYRTSERADDKEWTHQLWSPLPSGLRMVEGEMWMCRVRPPSIRNPSGENLPAPLYDRIAQGISEEAVIAQVRTFLSRLQRRNNASRLACHRPTIGLVVQPNHGTEGHGVACFEIGPDEIEQLTGRHPAVRYLIDELLSEGDALLREERGTLRYRHPEEADKGHRRITLRVHIAWNGSAFVAESGYAQVAPDQETFVASRSRGGIIIGLGLAFSHLYAFDPGEGTERPALLTPDDIARIRAATTRAAYALNRGADPKHVLKFMGIDLALEQSEADHHVTPVLLEANPRPAGLQHAEEIPSTLHQTPAPKVTFGLFTYIRSNLHHRNTERTEERSES